MLETVCSGTDPNDIEGVISHPRLFRNGPQLRFRGRVHEQLHPFPAELGYDMEYAAVQIRHLGYSQAALLQRKLQRDVRLLRMDYAVDPHDARTLVHLGTSYAQLGNAAEARRQVLADVTAALAALDAARLRIGITQTSVQAAQEDLRVQQERFRLGAATIVEVLTSQEALDQAEVDAVNARFDYVRARADLSALIGRPL